jgi:cellulose synthase/poly-beta-1,6-N-acetylglucosamine synthase-like glycosyltransferase/GGDEF domain-containing protein
VRELGFVGGNPDPHLQELAELAREAVGVPLAMVTVVDAGREYLAGAAGNAGPWASAAGVPLARTPAWDVVATRNPVLVADARDDLRFIDGPLAGTGFRSYAAVPLVNAAGYVVGAFAVAGPEPRTWTDDDVDVLTDFAFAAMAELEVHRRLPARPAAEAAPRQRWRGAERRSGIGAPAGQAGRKLLAYPAFMALLQNAAAHGRGCLVHLGVHELPRLEAFLGRAAAAEVAAQLADRVLAYTRASDTVAWDSRRGRFAMLLPGTGSAAVAARLGVLSREIAAAEFPAGDETVRLTPVVGVAQLGDASPAELSRRAELARVYADTRLDLLPARYEALSAAHRQDRARAADPARALRLALPLQVAGAVLLPVLVPLALYFALAAIGLDPTPVVYLVVVAALVFTALALWVEAAMAVRPAQPPGEPEGGYPPASAIIAAYLPNEAATVVHTVEAFLGLDYPGPLQVLLAYNAPVHLPVEATLAEIARRDPRFRPLRVDVSTSKAQNINAALREVTGEFVGIFDADHHPRPDSFRRAWRWLAGGADVVQGHCTIRNGSVSWLSRLVAVEFESIYAVSHPGRARLHGFGIFGGSNGYWRTGVLHEVRMRMFMLTEDIDASIRAVAAGRRIVNDPRLVSGELAPATLGALWHQRMRWAQGWFQVSRRYLPALMRNDSLTPRQKAGMAFLLGWSQVFPWISSQVLPILLFWILMRGWGSVDWLVPLFVATTVFTVTTGPLRTAFSYHLADPALRRRPGWFLMYLLVEPLVYTPLKNLITRVSHLKELMGEQQWKVTPRQGGADAPGAAS